MWPILASPAKQPDSRSENWDEIDTLLRKSDTYKEKEQYSQALEALHEVEIILPGYKETKKRRDAILEELKKLSSENLDGLLNKGRDLFEKKQYEQAIKVINQYRIKRPRDMEAAKIINRAEHEISILKKEKT